MVSHIGNTPENFERFQNAIKKLWIHTRTTVHDEYELLSRIPYVHKFVGEDDFPVDGRDFMTDDHDNNSYDADVADDCKDDDVENVVDDDNNDVVGTEIISREQFNTSPNYNNIIMRFRSIPLLIVISSRFQIQLTILLKKNLRNDIENNL